MGFIKKIVAAWRFRRRNTDWDYHIAFFRKRLIDGTEANDLLMRRRVDGKCEYRKATREEELQFQDDMAI